MTTDKIITLKDANGNYVCVSDKEIWRVLRVESVLIFGKPVDEIACLVARAAAEND